MIAPIFGDNGGPGVMVQNLTDALVEKGVDMTLFAPADWKTKARLVPTLKKSLKRMKNYKKFTKLMRNAYLNFSQIKVLKYERDFDIIHLHLQSFAYAVCSNLNKPCVLTFHSPITEPEFTMIKKAGIKTVAISRSQMGSHKAAAVISSGVPVKKIIPSYGKGKYLIAIGRMHTQKGIDLAIKIALKAQKKLLIFGRVENSIRGHRYFNKKIKPRIDGKKIIYMNEVSNKEIIKYLKKAEALLFPIRKSEVFGMVVAEALACGTPVIGSRMNPLPENLHDKKVAFLSDNINSLIKAAKNTDQFDRKKCREYAEKYFDSSLMADRYIKLYSRFVKRQ